jgi:hypothetical protein
MRSLAAVLAAGQPAASADSRLALAVGFLFTVVVAIWLVRRA